MPSKKIDFEKLLHDFQQKTGKSIPTIAEETGLNLENLYKWNAGTQPRDFHDQLTLLAYLSTELENLPGMLLKEEPVINFITSINKAASVRIPLKSRRKVYPSPDGSIAYGTIIDNDGEPELIAHRVDGSFLIQVEGVLQIQDYSMYPVYKPGTYMHISRLHDWGNIIYGDCYYIIIDEEGQGIFRRIFKGNKDDNYRLEAQIESERFPPQFRSRDQIFAILRVMGGYHYDDKFPAMEIPVQVR